MIRRLPHVDRVGIEERAATLGKRSIKTTAKQQGIRLAVSMIDLTTLEGADTPGKVRHLCAKAVVPAPTLPEIPSCAAVCVYPSLIGVVREALDGTGVRAASVATAFPSGQASLELKLRDTEEAVAAGAEEIDMVISREAFLAGEDTRVMEEIVRVKEACGEAHLKVIIETAELGSYDHVRHASMLAMEAGADFIKTSTGKAASGATPGVTLVMLEAIRDYAERSGRAVGMKAAGGVSNSKAALHRLVLVKETLGDEWLSAGPLPHRRLVAAERPADAVPEDTDRALRPSGGLLKGMTTSDTRTKIVWDYAPAPESPEHVRLKDSYGLFIGGEFRDPTDGTRVPSVNPATEEPLAEVAFAGEADLRAAVESARAAQAGWAGLPALERGKYLFRVARLIQERAREFAVVESMDGGKPIRESRDIDVPLAAAHFFHYAGWTDKLAYGVGGREVAPLGVAAQIVPWNFPLLMAAWKLAPALACGNTCVLKPAETTPLTALLLAEVIQEAELPPGVVSIVPGDGAAGAALVRQPGIDKVAFTGSTAVGRDIQAALAGRGVSLTLELGGKSANVVFEDAALDQAVEGIVNGIFFNQGHVCCAGSRLLIQESVADVVIGKLWERMGRLRLGDPLDKNTDVGAINSREQLERIEELVVAGEGEGALRRTVACELPERGYWFAPTIFTEVAPAHRIAVEEIFGPVVSVLTFRTQAEAIEKANNSPYGLAAGIWTDKGAKAFEVAAALQAGVVWQNTYNHFDPTAAFGGYKESGFGREGGPAGLRPYLRVVT